MNTICSIVCPVLNEEGHIGKVIEDFLAYCPQPSELFIADGGSVDRTREVVGRWLRIHHNIFLVENPDKYVSHAFNRCFEISKGKYLALLGAHSEYSPMFFKSALANLESSKCDAVGGPLIHTAKTATGKAIAYGMSTKFGVGGTEFRTSSARQYVDSVAFAFYRREVFEKIGLFDEQLIRNQDDEFHYRMNAAGLKILMVPEMQCNYFVRETIAGLFRQYYQYGLFKPLVLKKVNSGVRLRHLVPAFFVIYLIGILPLFIVAGWVALLPLLLYFVLALYFCDRTQSRTAMLRSFFVFPVLHVSYGFGFLVGLGKLI